MDFTDFIKRFRFLILASGILAISLGFWFSKGLNLDPSLQSRFLKGNSQIGTYRDLEESFGTEPLLAVVWETQGPILEKNNRFRLGQLTNILARTDGIQSVISLSNLSPNQQEPDAEILKQLPLVKKLLLAPDGKKTILALVPEPEAILPSKGLLLTKRIESGINQFLLPTERAFLTGPLAMQSKAIELSRRDLLFSVLAVALSGIILFSFIYKSWRTIAAAVLVTMSGVSFALGIMAILRVSLSQFALMAIPILAAVGFENAVYFIGHFTNEKNAGADDTQALSKMFQSCTTPCLWAVITTIAGFATLLLSDISQIRSIGLIIVTGIPFVLIASLTLLPSVLVGIKKQPPVTPGPFLTATIKKYPILLAFVLIVSTLVLSYGIRFVHLRFDFPRIFKTGTPPQIQLAEMDEKLFGGASFEILMQTTDGTDFSDPEKFKLIQSMQMAMGLTAPVATIISPIDIGITAYVLENGIPKNTKTLRNERTRILRKIRASDDALLRHWLSKDLKKVRIHVRVRTDKQEYYDKMIQALNYLKGRFATVGVDVSWSGLALLYKDMEKKMLAELIRNCTMAFVTVCLLLIVLFRSVKWGLLAMIPNVLPILITMGIMGWAGTNFSLALMILPAVGLGLIVDDTIHIMWGMKQGMKQGLRPAEAVEKTLSGMGRACILSSVVLMLGFVSLAPSGFISNIQLALWMPILLALALLFDLVALPLGVMLWNKKPAD